MPAVYQTDNPLEYTALDGVIVTEKNPPPTVVSAGSNNCIFLAKFEKGPKNTPTFVSSISELQSIFGENTLYSGNVGLQLKKWSNLYVTRVVASDSVKATHTLVDSGNDLVTFTAKSFGVYGNSITYTISAGTLADTYRVIFTLDNVQEVFDNVVFLGQSNEQLAETFKTSTLLDVSDTDNANDVELVSNQALALGSDGVVTAGDYKIALDNSNVPVSGKLFFADDQSAGVKAVLSNFVKIEKAGQCILGPSGLDVNVADAIADFNIVKDNEGRVIYVYNPVSFNVSGVITEESPVYLASSILNLSPPHKSPSAASSVSYTSTAVDVKYNLSRANLILLRRAGINSFENDSSLGIKLVSGVTGDSQFSILRRRMSDFYINSVSNYLKYYLGEPISILTKNNIKSSIIAFDTELVNNGILPSNAEVSTGSAFLVQTDGISSDREEAQGILKIELKRRLYASADFIVLIATISEAVVVEEV